MAGQRGRDVLIKISDGHSPEAFETLAGIRSTEFELNAGAVDGTSADSPEGWRELIAGAGIKTARIRGQGLFKDAISDERMRQIFISTGQARWQLIVPGIGVVTGSFHIRELKWTGAFDSELGFSIDLESAGQLTFEAAS